MRVRSTALPILVLLCAALFLPCASAQGSNTRSAAVERVRRLYFIQDEEAAGREAKDLVAKYPTDLELKAWYAVLGGKKEAQPMVSEMSKTDPESAWTLLAKASTFSNGWEMKGQCENAVDKEPDNTDLLVLATRLMASVLERPDDQEALKTFQGNLIAFLDSNKPSFEKTAEGLAARAEALQELGRSDPDKSRDLEIGELCDRALKLDGKNVTAAMVKAHWLSEQQKKKEAYELLKSTAQAVPDSFALHMAYWRSVVDMPSTKTEDQVREITADAGRFFAAVKPATHMVFRASGELGESNSVVVDAIGDLILKQYADTGAADTVLFLRAIKEDPMMVAERDNPAQVHALEAFLDRPKHFDDSLVRQANGQLASLLTASEHPDLDRLYKAVISQEGDDTEGISVLAENKVHLPELELFASKQLDAQWKVIYERMLNQSDKQGFMDFGMANWVAAWQSTLGWVYFNEGKLEQAQEKIESALALYQDSPVNTIRLGRIVEAQGKKERAEQLYTEALSMGMMVDGEHPAVKALRESYVRRHGNTEGLDAYMKPILVKDQERRKKDTLNARIASPRPIPAFSLTSLDGKMVTSESLKGKIVVINFWATWCGPCRKELPDFDKYYQKYKNDPNVVVLSIATDDANTPLKEIQDFVAKRKYTFPVLLAPVWAKQNMIQPIPMTWFVDANGNKLFQKIGYTKELMEEYDWRVEAIQKNMTPQAEKNAAGKSE
jgi:thiol-disulfide isomerase/thioredoxin/tetratricopeptide (TPR) repeat protein